MSVHLYLAPAAAGKTACVLARVREASHGLRCIPRVCLPSHLHVRAWRRRLARDGGAIGVRLLTFDQLYAECLTAAGEVYTELSDPVQYRLIRTIVDSLVLTHYAPLTDRPGFIHVLQKLIAEWKAARIQPDDLSRAVTALGAEPRLRELVQVYTAYQEHLQLRSWADRAGCGWLAVEALEERAPAVACDWPLLLVDGFDNFTPVQMAMLRVLAGRVGDLIITLTGTADGSERPLVHRRFKETRERLEYALRVAAVALPVRSTRHAPVLAHLEDSLYRRGASKVEAAGALELFEAPDRATEVRAALRWLKERLVQDGLRPGDTALLARSISPYRPFILQTAAEFGLPVRLLDGLALRTNPAVAALLDLLRLMLPLSNDNPEPALPRRLVVEAWRSPYFDWSARPTQDAPDSIAIAPGDAEALDVAARAGRVVGGLSQWQETLRALAERPPADQDDREEGLPVSALDSSVSQSVVVKFQRFVQRLTPPPGKHRYRDLTAWLEGLIGSDPASESARHPLPEEPMSLQVIYRVQDAADMVAELDVSALRALKDVLRGLVWAEEAIERDQLVDFARFFSELVGAVEATTYNLPANSDWEEILVADVTQARGIPFTAVAVLGLAEGEFPATLSEDPFLRDADRQRLREDFDLPLESSTRSAEFEYFYESITRARDRLLLSRPRLADNGAMWQASPFWEEVCDRVNAQPLQLSSESVPPPGRVASWPELMESLATHREYVKVREWVQQKDPHRLAALDLAAELCRLRWARTDKSPFDGALASLAREFGQRFGSTHIWSSSRLEHYRTCPFFFFISDVLRLEPREEPAEGLDPRQLGNIYHRILEQVYQAPSVTAPTNLDQLLAALPAVAQRVLDEAPRREGFRETAWWAQTRQEILDNVARSLEALDSLRVELQAKFGADFVPTCYEARFFEPQALTVSDGKDQFRLHGVIDRVDRSSDGRLLIIDYKTGGPYGFTNKAVAEGEKLQLPLYALAARDGLKLGDPVEGFYWHVQHCKRSPFTLSGFQRKEKTSAIAVALDKAWETVRQVRAGRFVPCSPSNGCPPYCPAAAFCWHYRSGYGG